MVCNMGYINAIAFIGEKADSKSKKMDRWIDRAIDWDTDMLMEEEVYVCAGITLRARTRRITRIDPGVNSTRQSAGVKAIARRFRAKDRQGRP